MTTTPEPTPICSVEELYNCPEEKCTAELHEGAVWKCAGSCEDDPSGLAAFNEAYGGDYLQSCDQVPALAKSWDWPDLCTETPTCERTCAACVIVGCSVEELQKCPEEECTAELHEGAVWRCAGSCEDDDAGFATTMQNYGYEGWQSCEQVPAAADPFGMTISAVCDFTPMCARTCAVGCVICSVEELQNCPEEKCTADLHEGALLDI